MRSPSIERRTVNQLMLVSSLGRGGLRIQKPVSENVGAVYFFNGIMLCKFKSTASLSAQSQMSLFK